MRPLSLRLVLCGMLSSCFYLVGSTPGISQDRDQINEVVNKYSANSPAGGPSKNADAAVFVFLRASKKLCYVVDGKIVSVEIQPTREMNDKNQGGPTPVGEYLIGKRYTHETHMIDWYKLYPRIEDNSGYYGYTAKTKTGRFAMGLHPGSTSLGCVTVRSFDRPYDKAEAWKSVRAKLDQSKLRYKNDDFSGFLYVEDK